MTFFGSRVERGDTLTITLLFRPDLTRDNNNGQQLDNYAVAEFVPADVMASRISVVIHELCHYLFALADDSAAIRLGHALRTSSRPGAIASRHLLDEALATALGNGVVRRTLSFAASVGAICHHAAVDVRRRKCRPRGQGIAALG